MNSFKRYIIFWLTQSVSQLGSAMTSFALVLLVYTWEKSAMAVSLMTFFNFVPYIIVSYFAGAFVDRSRKKRILIVSDVIAAMCTLVIFALNGTGALGIWHIYAINFVIGLMTAFQAPALAVAIGRMVPDEKLEQVSGMNSFSQNLVAIASPVLASAVFGFAGIEMVLVLDLASFVIAFAVLVFVVTVPEEISKEQRISSVLTDTRDGFRYLKDNHGIFLVIITLAVINFISRLTYENILSPMILARSGNSSIALGIVNAAMGLGGVIGGIIVATGRVSGKSTKMIFIPALLSFLLGDITMGISRNVAGWSFAAICASLPIPFIQAGQNAILYRKVPLEMQGRVFALANAVKYTTVPIAILLGGFLADYIFEPMMNRGSALAEGLQFIVGSGAGSGMAVMFICTGIIGSTFSFFAYRTNSVQALENKK